MKNVILPYEVVIVFACLRAVHVDGPVGIARGQVLVIRRETDAEAVRHGSVAGIHGVFGPDSRTQHEKYMQYHINNIIIIIYGI